MKNIEIFNLAGSGIFSVSANTLDAAHAYKVIKFKSAVRKAAQAIEDAQKELTKEAGIDDPQAFDKEYQDLLKSKANPERLKELDGKFKRLMELRSNLYNEEATLDGVKTIPYEQFFALQKENKDIKEKPLENFADLLEGILWTGEPEESKAE
jgi:hypothetical protein